MMLWPHGRYREFIIVYVKKETPHLIRVVKFNLCATVKMMTC